MGMRVRGAAGMTIKEVSEKLDITQDTLRYYERIGVIPAIARTAGGIRSYQEADLAWVGLAKCMRSAGLPVEAVVEYVKLFQGGGSTIPARIQLLQKQKEALLERREQIDEALDRLNHKLSRYEIAVETGTLSWDK